MRRWLSALFAAAVLLPPAIGLAIDSVKLTDVIKSTGVGTIDLLKNTTSAGLEAYRTESGGLLRFAVDVNEAADGSEKASSQAVTLDTVELRVRIGGVDHVYSSFSTATQALLARAGTTTRLPYYTLIGESGSSRVRPNSIQERFDAVFEMPVDIDLSAATSAVLNVRLLAVNASLGDPEAFYDYSNGFEDVALVNSVDAAYLVALAPGRDEAPAVIVEEPPATGPEVSGWVSYPSATSFYTVGYEDSFPNRGDYDFNDLLVAYRVETGLDAAGDVAALRLTGFLVARGAGYSHDWHLRIPISGAASGTVETTTTDPDTLVAVTTASAFSGDLDIRAFADTRAVFPPPPGVAFTNTERSSPFVRGPRFDATVVLDSPIPPSRLADAPFDPYLVVLQTGYEVHLADLPPTAGSLNATEGLSDSRDPDGYPYAFVVPNNWPLPWEKTDVGRAYPELSQFVQSGERTHLDWYNAPAAAETRGYSQSSWEWSVPVL